VREGAIRTDSFGGKPLVGEPELSSLITGTTTERYNISRNGVERSHRGLRSFLPKKAAPNCCRILQSIVGNVLQHATAATGLLAVSFITRMPFL
jgi:hypothetical protein